MCPLGYIFIHDPLGDESWITIRPLSASSKDATPCVLLAAAVRGGVGAAVAGYPVAGARAARHHVSSGAQRDGQHGPRGAGLGHPGQVPGLPARLG